MKKQDTIIDLRLKDAVVKPTGRTPEEQEKSLNITKKVQSDVRVLKLGASMIVEARVFDQDKEIGYAVDKVQPSLPGYQEMKAADEDTDITDEKISMINDKLKMLNTQKEPMLEQREKLQDRIDKINQRREDLTDSRKYLRRQKAPANE